MKRVHKPSMWNRRNPFRTPWLPSTGFIRSIFTRVKEYEAFLNLLKAADKFLELTARRTRRETVGLRKTLSKAIRNRGKGLVDREKKRKEKDARTNAASS